IASRASSRSSELAGIAIQSSLGDPLTAIDVADGVLQYIKADKALSRDDVNGLIRAFRTVDVNDPRAVDFETLPWMVNPADPLSSLLPKPGEADAMISRLRTFGDNKPPPPRVTPSQVKVRVVDSLRTEFASQVSEELAKQRLLAFSAAAERRLVPVSEIRYAPKQVEEAKALLAYIPDAKLQPDSAQVDSVLLVLGDTFEGVYVPAPSTTV